jgi:hypothetical protein
MTSTADLCQLGSESAPVMEPAGSPPPYSNPAISTVANAVSHSTPDSSTTPFKNHLMTILGIPTHLSNHAD